MSRPTRERPYRGDRIIVDGGQFRLRQVAGFRHYLSRAGSTKHTHLLLMGFGTRWAWLIRQGGQPWVPVGSYQLSAVEEVGLPI